MSVQNPLEYFHPRNLFRTSSDDVIESAKQVINTANQEALTPEIYAKYRNLLTKMIDASPNKVATASYLLKHISENGLSGTYLTILNGCIVVKTAGRERNKQPRGMMEESDNGSRGRSTEFSLYVKSGGICQVTGYQTADLISSHILPFSLHKGNNQKMKQYLGLLEALFGPDALQLLLENVLNGGEDGARNVELSSWTGMHVFWKLNFLIVYLTEDLSDIHIYSL